MTYERQKRYRENQRRGLRSYTLFLPAHLVEMAVVDAGVIARHEADDYETVRAALQAHLTAKLSYQYPKRGGNYDKADNEED